LIVIAGIVSKSWDKMAGFFAVAGLATLALNVVSMGAGYWIAKLASLNRKQAITVGMEVGIQNGTMALLVTGTILQNTTMSIPAVTYSLLMFLTGAIFGWLVNFRKTNAIVV
jgi:BASS family bile acid:Na+ symporter